MDEPERLGSNPPPKPWERAGTSPGPAPFKPTSGGSTSDIVEASGTAKPGEVVSAAESNVTSNINSTISRPVPPRPWQQQGYGNSYGGYGSSMYSSYGGFGGPYSSGGLFGNNMYSSYGGGYGGIYGSSGMNGGSMYNSGMGGPYGGYGMGMGAYNQGPNAFGPPAPPPGFWMSFLRVMHGVVNFCGRVAFLFSQNTQAFHMFISALLQLCDRTGMLYGELARFVLRLLGIKTKPKKGETSSFEGFTRQDKMGEITNVTEYQAIAKQKLPKMIYDYYASGAEDEWTLKENREAFSRILFRPRILIDVSKIDMSTTVLGFKISMPIMIAPSAMQKMAHPEGEYATARAASAAGTIMTLSSWATSSVEEVASTGPGIRFFQLYVYKDRNVVEQLVRRAERAGFKAIALTVDTPRLGRREADIKNRFVLPPYLTLKNFEGLDLGKMDKSNDSGLASYVAGQIDRTLSWKDVKWLQSITSLPILVKGVITAEDARLAVHSGAAGIIVSNHGARQLDYVPATISALEEVVTAAQGRIPVYLDGGVRRGTDVFKALALGAAGVFIGRPVVFSLAAAGEAGVRNVLRMLREEFELTMALSGCTSLADITRSHIFTEGDRFGRPFPRL
ncbi:hypothetical protein E2562_012976 [Oryza meyeriana var. granulata]|uniref:(S)-2-hydroxy-acid oxidase n=1 Tax=Oryza meyeriana var. granulata TaxID=110450 RepID=A0A6G1DHX8_9ORYZ|nr:hypothetical protein E2562_012976 [Oryza meyeriana var. granulata]